MNSKNEKFKAMIQRQLYQDRLYRDETTLRPGDSYEYPTTIHGRSIYCVISISGPLKGSTGGPPIDISCNFYMGKIKTTVDKENILKVLPNINQELAITEGGFEVWASSVEFVAYCIPVSSYDDWSSYKNHADSIAKKLNDNANVGKLLQQLDPM